jgi:hypothetical protein
MKINIMDFLNVSLFGYEHLLIGWTCILGSHTMEMSLASTFQTIGLTY